MGKLAPEITTVSNPKRKPDKAATRIHLNELGIKLILCADTTYTNIEKLFANFTSLT